MFTTTNKCVYEWYFFFELKSGLNEVLLLLLLSKSFTYWGGYLLQKEVRDSNMDKINLAKI